MDNADEDKADSVHNFKMVLQETNVYVKIL